MKLLAKHHLIGLHIAILLPAIYSLRNNTELNWFYVIFFSAMISYFAGMIVCIIFWSLFAGAIALFYRSKCPHCETKNLRTGRMCVEDSDDEFITFMLSKCDQCHWQFRQYGIEEELIPISPEDERYWPCFKSGKVSG
jgi:hypothetical protein